MLPCARSVLRRRGPALLRGCAEGRREALANARCAATMAGLGGGRGAGVGRWSDPPSRGEAHHQLGGRWPAATQTRSFLGCGDGEEGSVLSKVYEEKRVMGYSPEQMYAVVAAVDLYEDFVPWCQRSRVVRRYDNGSFDAELEIGFKFFVESYVSHVEMEKPKYIKIICHGDTQMDVLFQDKYSCHLLEINPSFPLMVYIVRSAEYNTSNLVSLPAA